MKKYFLVVNLFLFSIFSLAQNNEKSIPEKLVQQQLIAYNARNIEAFLEPYSDEVELYMFPNQLLGKGKNFMRKDYAEMFKNTPNLHYDIKNRTVLGNTVIDHEVVSGFGSNHLEAIAIYEIKNDKIAKVYFIQK